MKKKFKVVISSSAGFNVTINADTKDEAIEEITDNMIDFFVDAVLSGQFYFDDVGHDLEVFEEGESNIASQG